MCGIAGFALTDATAHPDQDLLRRMCSALVHRGPDDGGGFMDPGIALSMRRLSIIDLPGGHQPIFNEDESVAVVFNGEIYNYPTLRQQLLAKGHEFRTSSDTETIVHLYEDYGLDFVRHLHGMFAIALWDGRQEMLVMVRDRLGVKPLYYYQDRDALRFGSEIKALLQDPAVPRHPNMRGLHQLLTLGHILPPDTCFTGIRELPPATVMTFRHGEVRQHSYWDLEFTPSPPQPFNRVVDELETRLREAVRCRLMSEVPLGAFLSGGIDSSLVVAMMSQMMDQPVKTFAIGFDDPSFSELPYARRVAQHCRTDHHELIVKPNVRELMDVLIAHHDAPFYDTSAIPTYHVSRFAREHVTVALSGDGGDEMFAGYNIYVANRMANLYQRIPQFVRRGLIEPLVGWIPETNQYVNRGRIAREFIAAATSDPLTRYTRWSTKVKRETREALYRDDTLRAQLEIPDQSWFAPFYEAASGATELGKLLYVATKTELHADMLRKVDRMSMAHSIEIRSPLLDHTLLEFATRLPDDCKLKGNRTKHALRQLAERLLPREVWHRPKRGFSIPLDRWLREDLRDYTSQILFDSRTEQRQLFHSQAIRQLGQEHFSGTRRRGRELWTLLTIELWHRDYIDTFAGKITNPLPLTMSPTSSIAKGR